MSADSLRGKARPRRHWKRLCVLGGILSCALLGRSFAVCGRRAAVASFSSALVGASLPAAVLGRPELSQDQENCLSECVYKCSGGVINSACFIPLRIMALHRDGLRPEERAQSSKIVPTASRSARREREAEECCKFSSETVGLWSD
eukprot:symbB.v1.2.036621.t2/scaffold5211.1/size29781/4